MPAALKVVSGPLRSRVLLLPSQLPFLVGRSLEADLTLNGPRVSERHLVIVPEGRGHRVVPISTRKPTRVRGSLLREARSLRHGDRLKIGLHDLIYLTDWERLDIGLDAPHDVPCATCGAELSRREESSLQALHIGGEVVCPRCVDHRLRADRDLESYRILRKIGTNKEEVTYLAVDLESNRRVAIRILKAERQARPRVFRRYLVRALAGLVVNHPNYLEVVGVRSGKGITFVVLEHVEKTTKLELLVRERSPIKVTDAIYLTNQLAEVLRYARDHELVVAKRKKSGVLIDPNFWVKVLAFDVTRELEAQVARTAAFRELAVAGGADPDILATEDLDPPAGEETRLSRLASEFAEVYSVGRILYQLLTGSAFGPGAIDSVRKAHGAVQADGKVTEGPLAALHPRVVELLERVIVPRGEARIRKLADFTRCSKVTYSAVCLEV